LDELERCGNRVHSEQQPGDEGPVGLEGLFDEREYESRLVLPLPRVWPRRVAAGIGLLAAAGVAFVLLVPRGAAPAPVPDPTPHPVSVALKPPGHHRVHRSAHHPTRRPARVRPVPGRATAPSPETTPSLAPTSTAQPAAGGGGVTLPDPGSVDPLPAP
jgi:hypothetical protein